MRKLRTKERKSTLGLPGGQENVGNDLIKLSDKFDERIIGNVLHSEFALRRVAGISLAKNGVTIACICERGNQRKKMENIPGITRPESRIARQCSANFSFDNSWPLSSFWRSFKNFKTSEER